MSLPHMGQKLTITKSILQVLQVSKLELTSKNSNDMFILARSSNEGNSLVLKILLLFAGLFVVGGINLVSAMPDITVNPMSGPPGSTITIIGSGFPNDTQMTLLFDHAPLEAPTISSSFKVSVTIPTSAAAGSHIITLTNIPESTYATFTVTTPTLVISPNTSVPGSAVTLSGSSFGASKSLAIRLDNIEIHAGPATLLSSDVGTFSATIIIPFTASAGAHIISVTDGLLTASEILSIPETSLTLSGASGPPGGSVIVTGVGFSSDSIITLKLDSKIIPTPTNITTSASGTFSAVTTIPYTEVSTIDVISATDSSGRTASAIINVIAPPSISVSKPYDLAGSNVNITGSNFNPNTPVLIKFDAIMLTDLLAVTTNSIGYFETTITIPEDATIGNHDIIAIDTSGKIQSSLITVVTPAIVNVSPETGAPGTEVIITGSNFFNNTKLSVKLNGVSVSTYPPNIVTGVAGKFLSKYLVPSDILQGNYTVTVEGPYGKTGSTTFRVMGEGLYVLPSPSSKSGWRIDVIGVGFTPNTNITMNFDGERVLTNPTKVRPTIAGTFAASFSAPGTAPNGNHTITAESDGKTMKTMTTTINLKRQYLDDRYGVLISAEPQKYDFSSGETVTITGKVLALTNSYPLLLKVLNPSNAACSFQQLYLDHDMNFKAEPLTLAGPLCNVEGEYSITAYYGSGKAITKFRVGASDQELTGGEAEVINAQKVLKILRYDNMYSVDLDWASNAVLLRNNVNQTISFYLMFGEFDANQITRKLSSMEVTLAPFEKNYVVAPYVPQIVDGKLDGYLHVFAWTSLSAPAPLHPGLYIPY